MEPPSKKSRILKITQEILQALDSEDDNDFEDTNDLWVKNFVYIQNMFLPVFSGILPIFLYAWPFFKILVSF